MIHFNRAETFKAVFVNFLYGLAQLVDSLVVVLSLGTLGSVLDYVASAGIHVRMSDLRFTQYSKAILDAVDKLKENEDSLEDFEDYEE